jgi:hypothetical protein
MILHDRSRLHEIADFVKPDLYSTTEFLLEYGWHHPDGNDYERNPFGALLNAMRVKEKYGIVNSSFQFEDNGEVRISLQLAMKGANEYRTVQIGNNEKVQGALREITNLQERIAEIRSAINSTHLDGKRGGKSVFGEQILEAAQSTNGNPTISLLYPADADNPKISNCSGLNLCKNVIGTPIAPAQSQGISAVLSTFIAS